MMRRKREDWKKARLQAEGASGGRKFLENLKSIGKRSAAKTVTKDIYIYVYMKEMKNKKLKDRVAKTSAVMDMNGNF